MMQDDATQLDGAAALQLRDMAKTEKGIACRRENRPLLG